MMKIKGVEGINTWVEVREVSDCADKARVCEIIMRALPSWFGNETAIVDYIEKVRHLPFYAAYHNGAAVGFIAVKVHNPHTAEICVMGVLPAYHRQGIGAALVARCEAFCAGRAMTYLTVKTLDTSGNSESYDKTRLFYQAMRFLPLEVFPLYWDADNPCLFMVKDITKNGGHL
jgi:GNAT superfamily N-acetyltransferase